MAFSGFNHIRQEGTDKVPLAENVNVKDLTKRFRTGFENGVGFADACVVNQNARTVEFGTDLIGGVIDLLNRGYVALIECDIGI